MQRFPHPRVAVPRDIASAGGGGAKRHAVVSYYARSLGAAAINAQVESHALVLTQRQAGVGGAN